MEQKLTAQVYKADGAKAGTIDLPEALFGVPWNPDLVHQVVVSMQGNARAATAHTKTRGEVRGGGKKPWRQKGTGRARHGSTRSPIWVGGGVAHGPRAEKSYARKINRKAVQKALLATLSQKLRDGEIIMVDALRMDAPSAKEAKEFLSAFARAGFGFTKKKNVALIALASHDAPTMKSFGNFGNVMTAEMRNLNPVSVLSAKYIVIVDPKAALDTLAKKSGKAAAGSASKEK
ncbi:MAG: 50S ribosomal protein L4 [Minisyncoccia bacterium]